MLVLNIYWHFIRIIKGLFYKMIFGKRFIFPLSSNIRNGFRVVIDKNGYVNIGVNCFFNNDCSIASMIGVNIGNGSIFGEGVKIYDHNHCYKDYSKSFDELGYTLSPVNIGSHCWIGSNVVILKGVTIGDNCVIGAGCVIHKDVPAGSVIVNKQELLYL